MTVGKDAHHVSTRDGTRLHDRPLPNSEPKPRALFTKLAQHGPLLVAVDQPATIEALPAAVSGEATRLPNRIRGLLTGIHPALERAIGPRISHPAVLEILSRCGGPTGLAKVGRRQLTAIAKVHAPRMGDRQVEAITTANEQNARNTTPA